MECSVCALFSEAVLKFITETLTQMELGGPVGGAITPYVPRESPSRKNSTVSTELYGVTTLPLDFLFSFVKGASCFFFFVHMAHYVCMSDCNPFLFLNK